MTSGLFKHDPVKGVIDSDIGRVFLMGSSAWARLKQSLFRDYSTGAASILYRAGIDYGVVHGRHAKRAVGDDPLEAIGYLTKLANQAGWGRIKIDMTQGSDMMLMVTVEDCVFCADIRNSNGVMCYDFAGIIAGIVKELFGENMAKETKCRCEGASVCEFSVVFAGTSRG
ncbi:MAG: hypothetical protein HYU39_04900 [Thaumarchaeota archaeon]|nr:hypothetical protein [Nitrososphaerota archaeon]